MPELDTKTVVVESYQNVCVLFTDLVGFTAFSQQVSPTELVKILNKLYGAFDVLMESHKLMKLDTIGTPLCLLTMLVVMVGFLAPWEPVVIRSLTRCCWVMFGGMR